MRKLIVIICIFLIAENTKAQDYDLVDRVASAYPPHFNSIGELVFRIDQDFNSPKEKVRAAFYWIATHVKYDRKESGVLNRPISFRTEAEYEQKKAEARKRLAKRVLERKVAVCQGYSSLFKEICDGLSIQNEYVRGCAKNEYKDIGRPFDSNHAWNLVHFEDESFLIDTTWGASVASDNKVDWYYFFPDPATLIRSHYPDNLNHSLLEDVPSKRAFMMAPMYYNVNLVPNFELIQPKENGILDTGKDQSFTFKYHVPIEFIGYSVGEYYTQIDNYTASEGTLEFTIYIPEKRNTKVLIFINGNAVVAYKTE